MIKKHLRYMSYILRHKWFVGLQCFREGLYWRGIVHDVSKFLPSEWFAYANFFYGARAKKVRDATGYYKPTDTGDAAFDMAWLMHQKRNDHHWQWWAMPEDGGGIKVLRMADRSVREMLCDWYGAGRAQGNAGGWHEVLAWYEKNKGNMQFHPHTRAKVEVILAERVKRNRKEAA